MDIGLLPYYGYCEYCLHEHGLQTSVWKFHFPHTLLNTSSSLFWIVAPLIGVRRYLTIVLIAISLVIGDVEHLSMYSLAIFVYLLWRNVYSSPLSIFESDGLFLLLLLSFHLHF